MCVVTACLLRCTTPGSGPHGLSISETPRALASTRFHHSRRPRAIPRAKRCRPPTRRSVAGSTRTARARNFHLRRAASPRRDAPSLRLDDDRRGRAPVDRRAVADPHVGAEDHHRCDNRRDRPGPFGHEGDEVTGLAPVTPGSGNDPKMKRRYPFPPRIPNSRADEPRQNDRRENAGKRERNVFSRTSERASLTS